MEPIAITHSIAAIREELRRRALDDLRLRRNALGQLTAAQERAVEGLVTAIIKRIPEPALLRVEATLSL